ncbi:YqcI/YcgG family protein [Mangrovibacillus cuniculi]|uniref:Cupin domain-containing protein n=1 Tax=Mangrovibacillus cuniculi TaxID=2593652 RepID=A0A7S8CA02_9BACI|nr:YqcI/YcgG family protein [Mangrovibacillus cuniculi]QPC46001.1 cupin domain-containing protein [Mangrovibacillus cuniculi]
MARTPIKQLYPLTNVPTWGKKVFQSFADDLLSEDNPFPCILGVEGLKKGSLRFCFIDSWNKEEDIKELAFHLRKYVEESRDLGKNTSFVAFFQPEETQTMQVYEKQFWSVLNALHEIDSEPWPADIPMDPDNHLWEFCFNGEPIFVVCNTPVHEKRSSRKAATFMITFQPRWVFDGINSDSIAGKAIKKMVRDRLVRYDTVAPHPELSWYGDKETREWKQYFLADENNQVPAQCPFHAAMQQQAPQAPVENNVNEYVKYRVETAFDEAAFERNVGGTLQEVVDSLLPVEGTGYVEVQTDAPNKAHPSHTHPTNEILHILNGSITFTVDDVETECFPGDRIYLPKGTVHSSVSGPEGCLYVIAILKENTL